MFKPLIVIDFCMKGVVTNLPKGFVYTIVPHVVSVEESQYFSSDVRGRDVYVMDSGGMYLTMVSRPIN
jgi:hypothetical protein